MDPLKGNLGGSFNDSLLNVVLSCTVNTCSLYNYINGSWLSSLNYYPLWVTRQCKIVNFKFFLLCSLGSNGLDLFRVLELLRMNIVGLNTKALNKQIKRKNFKPYVFFFSKRIECWPQTQFISLYLCNLMV